MRKLAFMGRFTQSIVTSSCILILCFALGAKLNWGQDATKTTENVDVPRVTATATAAGWLKSPAIVGTAIADTYVRVGSEPIGPRSYPQGINPLTGLPYPNEEAQARRNLIVKISNWPPKVRPQHGVNQADLVIEYEAEGGVTRFAAIFRNNTPEKVGSIRSARLIDIELINMYAAILAYSGTSGPIHEIYKKSNFRSLLLSPSFGDDCEIAGFCRDASLLARGYEHTLFGNTQKLWELATARNVNSGYRALGFTFDLQPDPGGADANDIYINWYNRTEIRWQYDEGSKRYLRYSDEIAHLDANDDSQLWADNLIMLQVAHYPRPDLFTPGSLDESYEVALWSQGQAYVMREGKLYRGYWRRFSGNRGEALSLIFGNEEPIMLKPGRSWITVMRTLDPVVISDAWVDIEATSTALARSDS